MSGFHSWPSNAVLPPRWKERLPHFLIYTLKPLFALRRGRGGLASPAAHASLSDFPAAQLCPKALSYKQWPYSRFLFKNLCNSRSLLSILEPCPGSWNSTDTRHWRHKVNRTVEVTGTAVKATPQDHPIRATILNSLGKRLDRKCERTGPMDDFNHAVEVAHAFAGGFSGEDPRGQSRCNGV